MNTDRGLLWIFVLNKVKKVKTYSIFHAYGRQQLEPVKCSWQCKTCQCIHFSL